MNLIIKYFKYAIKHNPKIFLLSIMISIILSSTGILTPFITKYFLEKLSLSSGYEIFILGLFLIALYLLLKIIILTLWALTADIFGGKVVKSLIIDCETALSKAYMNDVEKLNVNNIKHTLYADVINAFSMISNFFPSLLGAILVTISAIVFSFYYNIAFTLIILISLFTGFLLSFSRRKVLMKLAGKSNKKLKLINESTNQFVSSLPLIQTNNILPHYHQKVSTKIDDFIVTVKKEDQYVYFWTGLITNFNQLITIALSAFFALPFVNGSIINLVFLMSLSSIILSEGQRIESLFQTIIKNHICFKNINQILELPKRNGNIQLEQIEEIVFRDVNFGYNESTNILINYNVKINSGDNILLQGKNGSGKSTFIKLLSSLYKVDSGDILLNQRNINLYSQETLNNQILYINQDEVLINGSIKQYFEVINKDIIPNERYQELLKYVNLDDENLVIENEGLSISPGQRKKLLIIKLLLRYQSSSVIILDELESGLDQPTREIYHQLLKEIINQNKILIIIEHNDFPKELINKTLSFN